MRRYTNMNRTPPHDTRAEEAVLGAIFLEPQTLAKATQYLKPRDFYIRANQYIYYAMLMLSEQDEAIDGVTIPDFLKQHHHLQDCGGYKYIAKLAESVPTATNIGYYAKIVQNKSISRRLIRLAQNIEKNSYSQKTSVSNQLNQAESGILNVSQETNSKGLTRVNRIINTVFKNVNHLSEHHTNVTGLSTGYRDIDRATAGLHKGEFIVIAARPNMGKTTFALNIAQNVAKQSGKTVAFFSAEMGSDSIVERMICAGARIDSVRFRTGMANDQEMRSAIASMGSLSNTNIYIDDTPQINISALVARAQRLAKQSGNLGLIVVDYLQLVRGNDRENRQQEVSEVSQQLQKLARSLNVPVIALAQLSRSVEQREDKRPKLSDIRESGSIEQDADIVAFLYRKDYYQRRKQNASKQSQQKYDKKKQALVKIGEPSITDFLIEKNRSGDRDDIKLMFLKAYNKFSSIIHHHENKNHSSSTNSNQKKNKA